MEPDPSRIQAQAPQTAAPRAAAGRRGSRSAKPRVCCEPLPVVQTFCRAPGRCLVRTPQPLPLSLASLLPLSSLTCQVSAVPNPPKACPLSAATSTGAYSWARDLTFLNLQCPRQKDQLRSWEAPDSSGVLPCLSLMARNSSSLQSSHTPSGYKSGILLLYAKCKVLRNEV